MRHRPSRSRLTETASAWGTALGPVCASCSPSTLVDGEAEGSCRLGDADGVDVEVVEGDADSVGVVLGEPEGDPVGDGLGVWVEDSLGVGDGVTE